MDISGRRTTVIKSYLNTENHEVLYLNKAVGGVATSQHQKGEAADLNAGDPAKNRELFDKIVEMQKTGRIAFDQLIDEAHYSWVHISYRKTGNRGQVLHL